MIVLLLVAIVQAAIALHGTETLTHMAISGKENRAAVVSSGAEVTAKRMCGLPQLAGSAHRLLSALRMSYEGTISIRRGQILALSHIFIC